MSDKIDKIAGSNKESDEASVSWCIEYDNHGNGSFYEWWDVINVKNKSRHFKCYSEEDADWLCNLLNKVASS